MKIMPLLNILVNLQWSRRYNIDWLIGHIPFNMAANSQQFWMRTEQNPRRVHEVSTSSLENRVEELTSLMRQFITGG